MGDVKIPYYWVSKYGMGHWKPGKGARALGFSNVPCGKDGPIAWAKAKECNRRLNEAKLRGPVQRDDPSAKKTWEDIDNKIYYKPGTIGAGFQAYRKLDALWKDGKEVRTRDEWGLAWGHIKQLGHLKPSDIDLETLVLFRKVIEEENGHDRRYRVIKIWRALWTQLEALDVTKGKSDPSRGFTNPAPKGRSQTWNEGEVVRLAKEAWRMELYATSLAIAITWDTQMSPGDVRDLLLSQRKRDAHGTWFETSRNKTAKDVIATLSRRTERLLDAYLAKMDAIPLNEPFLRTRTGSIFTTNSFAEYFRKVRNRVYPGDKRQMLDFRRSGAVESLAGGASAETISKKMSNNLAQNQKLMDTYVPGKVEVVRSVDKARITGRNILRGESE